MKRIVCGLFLLAVLAGCVSLPKSFTVIEHQEGDHKIYEVELPE